MGRPASSFILIVALLAGAASMAARGETDSLVPLGSPPPKIGALLPLTGAIGHIGTPMGDAVQLVQEQVNASGGIRGTNLTLVVADTGSTVSGASDGAAQLAAQGVHAVVGGATSGEANAAFPILEGADIPMVAPSATSWVLTTIDSRDLLWRATASTTLQGEAAAHAAYTELGYRRVGILARDDDYGQRLASAFDENFTDLGGTVSAAILYNPNAPDHTADLTALFATAPEAVFLASFNADGGAILGEWWLGHDQWPAAWITVEAMRDQATFDDLRSTGVNTTGIAGVAPGPSPAVMGIASYGRYRDAYATRYGGDPPVLSETAYDAAFVLALAMDAVVTVDPEALRWALRYVANPPGRPILAGQWAEAIAALSAGEDIDYWGAANRIDFDEYGDVGTAFNVWQVNESGVLANLTAIDEPAFWTPAAEGLPPMAVRIASPAPSALVSGSVPVLGQASAATGVDRVEVRVDAGPWQIATGTSEWTFVLATTLLADGAHDLIARVIDAGNRSTTATTAIVVDNTPPQVRFSPTASHRTQAEVTVSWAGSDATSGIERYEIGVDEGPFESMGLGTSRRLVLADGDHTVRVRAFDRAGHSSAVDVLQVRVDTNAFSFSRPYGGAPAVALPAAIGALLVLLWLRGRRRRQRPT